MSVDDSNIIALSMKIIIINTKVWFKLNVGCILIIDFIEVSVLYYRKLL